MKRRKYDRPSPVTDAIQHLVNRTIGFATSESPVYTQRQAARAVERLVHAGKAFPARVTRMHVRYFRNAELAEAYVRRESRRVSLAPRRRKPVPDTVAPVLAGSAEWDRNAEPVFPVDKNGKPKWKFTLCPPDQTGLNRTNTHSDIH